MNLKSFLILVLFTKSILGFTQAQYFTTELNIFDPVLIKNCSELKSTINSEFKYILPLNDGSVLFTPHGFAWYRKANQENCESRISIAFEKANPNIKFIIAPHDITHQRLQNCLTLYKNAVLYSDYVQQFNTPDIAPQKFNTLIIDNVGMLSKLYHYATVSYIGGGFGAEGIHNVLEPAAFGKPVFWGPNDEKYIDDLKRGKRKFDFTSWRLLNFSKWTEKNMSVNQVNQKG